MYVYSLGIVDWFHGMTMLEDYIQLCAKEDKSGRCSNKDDFSQYLSINELKKFLIRCFVATKYCEAGWEGDIRSFSEIAIGAIPWVDNFSTYKFIVFKQDNKGESFLVSEYDIYTMAIFSSIEDFPRYVDSAPRVFTIEKIEKWINDSYDLAEDLIKHSFGMQKSKEDLKVVIKTLTKVSEYA